MSWANEHRSGMNLKQAARYVLPPIAIDVARRLVARRRRPVHAAGGVRISYELVPVWTTPKPGTATFDFDVVNRPAASELDVPVVRDNLEALALIASPDATLRLLDVGCSNGHYKPILATNRHTRKWQYVGVDLAREVAFCRRHYPDTPFHVVEEGGPLPFGDDEFDVVLASGVIQYIRDVVVALAEFQRVTRDYVVVGRLPTWKYEDSGFLVQHFRDASGDERYPLHVFNRRAIEGVFEKTGLSVVSRDSGSEYFSLPGIREPVTHALYLLRKRQPA
jgi:putative methyltransferase (TIGR04325 family)